MRSLTNWNMSDASGNGEGVVPAPQQVRRATAKREEISLIERSAKPIELWDCCR